MSHTAHPSASTAQVSLVTGEQPAATTSPTQSDMQQALRDLASGDKCAVDQARKLFTGLLLTDPEHPIGLLGCGLSAAMAGNLVEARRHLLRATQVAPKLASAWINLGGVATLEAQFKEAQRCYEQALQIDPALTDAHLNISRLHFRNGEKAAASQALARALMFKPDHADAHQWAAELALDRGDVEDALSHLRQALAVMPKLRHVRLQLIMLLYRTGRLPEAQSISSAMMNEVPDDPDVFRAQAAGLVQSGRTQDARRIQEKLLTSQPNAVDVRLNMAQLLQTDGEHDKALTIYRELMSEGGVAPSVALTAIGQTLLSQRLPTQAEESFKQALALDRLNAMAWAGLSRAQELQGDVMLAIQSLAQVKNLRPQASDVLWKQMELTQLLPSNQVSPVTTDTLVDEIRVLVAQNHDAEHTLGDTEPRSACRVLLVTADLESPTEDAAFVQQLLAQTNLKEDALQWLHCGPVGTMTNRLAEAKPKWHRLSGGSDDEVLRKIAHLNPGEVWLLPGMQVGQRFPLWTRLSAQTNGPVRILRGNSLLAHIQTALATAPLLNNGEMAFVHKGEADLSFATKPEQRWAVRAPLAQCDAATLDTWASMLVACPEAKLVYFSGLNKQDAANEKIRRLLLIRDVAPEQIEVVSDLTPEEEAVQLARCVCVLDTNNGAGGWTCLRTLRQGCPVLTVQPPSTSTSASALGPHTAQYLQALGLQKWVADSTAHYAKKGLDAIANWQSVHAATSEAIHQVLLQLAQHPAIDRALDTIRLGQGQDSAVR